MTKPQEVPEYDSFHGWLDRLAGEWRKSDDAQRFGMDTSRQARLAVAFVECIKGETNGSVEMDLGTATHIRQMIWRAMLGADRLVRLMDDRWEETAIAVFAMPLALGLAACFGRGRALIPVGEPTHA